MKKINLLIMTVVCIFTMACCGQKSAVSSTEKIDFGRDDVWQLTSIRERAVTYAEGQDPITIQFNPEAKTLNGHSGCNSYFGDFEYTNNGDNGTIAFDHVGSTRMACPEPMMQLEDQYLPLLGKVDSFKLTAYKLTLMQGDKVLLEYDKQ